MGNPQVKTCAQPYSFVYISKVDLQGKPQQTPLYCVELEERRDHLFVIDTFIVLYSIL
jgi:hypothetical protein